jgi:hypothetical protein
MVALESDKNQNDKFNSIVQGQANEYGDDDLEAKRITCVAYVQQSIRRG